jgi:hypothetical protein
LFAGRRRSARFAGLAGVGRRSEARQRKLSDSIGRSWRSALHPQQASGRRHELSGGKDPALRPWRHLPAEWDADLPSDQARGYFAKLTSVPYKRFVELGEGTHTIMMEKNRMQFFREVMNFLNESDPLALN